MARYTDSKCKLCRRTEEKLFLKGSRCESEKCALTRRQKRPGQHGKSRRRRRLSDYGVQLREKQKVKWFYGVLERQFRRYLEEAGRSEGKTGQVLLSLLERRLDNVLCRLGFAASRSQARQLIRQGKVRVNEKRVLTPSFRVGVGDRLSFPKERFLRAEGAAVPRWLKLNKKTGKVKVVKLPERGDADENIDEQVIVDFYSR